MRDVWTASTCHGCGEPTLAVRDGKLYRKERLLPNPDDEERCDWCGSAMPRARERGYVDLWVADSGGMH